MRIVAVALIAFFFMVPQARALIAPLVDRTERLLDANLPLFLIAFLIAIVASVLSWGIAQLPRAEPSSPYRVVRRFRV